MMKAVILARVSTKEQEDGHSLDAQIANLRRHADQHSLNIIKEYTVIESSTKGDRPEFMRMINFVKAQKEKVVLIVDTVDRLQRSFKETPILDELIKAGQLDVHFVKEGNILDENANSMQKLMWNMGVVMAQSYTDSLSDNVKRSNRHKIANGELCGPAPLGYLNSIDASTAKKTVILDPERSFLIRKIFEEYALGVYSLAEMCRKANEWGLRSRKGNKISSQTLHGIIKNPFYYGMMSVNEQLHPHKYERLLSKDLFDACEAVREGRGRTQAVSKTKHPFILGGLLKCAVSGRTVSCDIKKGKHIYLIGRDPKNPDKKVWTNEKVVLEQIGEVFKSIQIPDAVMMDIMAHLKKTHQSEKDFHHASIKSLRREADQITHKLDKLLDMFMDESITKDIHDKKHGQLVQRRQEINDLLERHHEGDDKFKMAVSTLVSLASKAYDIFERSTVDEKRQLIGRLFSNLELEGSKLRYILKTPFNLFVDLDNCKKWLPRKGSNLRPGD